MNTELPNTTNTIIDDYIIRHPTKNLFSLETLIYCKLIKCELVNRPIKLRSRSIIYSFWIEVNQDKKEYQYFTMDKNFILPGNYTNKRSDRIRLRKQYEDLFNIEFEYKGDVRIKSPHRIFISSIPLYKDIDNKILYQISDIRSIISNRLNTLSKLPTTNIEYLNWVYLIESIYQSDIPIDCYYKLGKFPRHDEVFTDKYLNEINAIGRPYIKSNNFDEIYQKDIIYAFKSNSKMNIILFSKCRELYNSHSWFRKLSINQLLLTNHKFYELNFSYIYCYTNILRYIQYEIDKTKTLLNNENLYLSIEQFEYEYTQDDFIDFNHVYIKDILNESTSRKEKDLNDLFISDEEDNNTREDTNTTTTITIREDAREDSIDNDETDESENELDISYKNLMEEKKSIKSSFSVINYENIRSNKRKYASYYFNNNDDNAIEIDNIPWIVNKKLS